MATASPACMQLFFSKFYLAVIAIGSLLVSMRFYNFTHQFRFIPDNGLEYAVMRYMQLDRCMPMVGPLLSVHNVFIPPTYFYYFYLLSSGTYDPLLTGYLSGTLKILTIVFLACTVWLVTNRKFFLISLITLTSSWLLFDVSHLVWHPNPVNMILALSILLLTYAKLKQRWSIFIVSCIFYWMAASIYPSPILLLPWYLWEIYRWPRSPQRRWWIQILVAISSMALTALPFYLPQLIFEATHHWPTFQTLLQLVTNPAAQAVIGGTVAKAPATLADLHGFLIIQIFHLRYDWPGFIWTVWLMTLGPLILGIASIWHKSHTWHFYFPYLPLSVLLAQFLIINKVMPGELNQHWLTLFFIILIPSAFEAAYKLWHSIPLRLLSIAICAILLIHNGGYYWESLTVATHEHIPDQLIAKTVRMEKLTDFWTARGIRPKDTLVLDHSRENHDFNDLFALQYDAMENWTLLHYQTLIPRLTATCNEYAFFDEATIRARAKNIFVLEPKRFPEPPEKLFEIFEKKFSFDLSETARVTWYVAVNELP